MKLADLTLIQLRKGCRPNLARGNAYQNKGTVKLTTRGLTVIDSPPIAKRGFIEPMEIRLRRFSPGSAVPPTRPH